MPQAATAFSVRRARRQALCSLAALSFLSFLLPGPGSWVDLFGGTDGSVGVAVSADWVVQQAILATASVLVWALLVWCVVVWGAAAAGRLPGRVGGSSRALLARIAPASAARIVAATVGLTLLTGTSACAAPVLADSGGGSPPAVTSGATASGQSSSAASSTVSSAANGQPSSTLGTSVLPSIAIDWPDAVASGSTAVGSGPGSTAPATSTPPTSRTAPAISTASATSTAQASSPPTPSRAAAAIRTSPAGDTARTSGAAPASSTNPAPVASVPAASASLPAVSPGGPSSPVTDAAATDAVVAVRPGDTLWAIATRHLPPQADDAAIDTAWRAWYSVNRSVIGADPDLIEPGQLLLPPPNTESGR